MEGRRIPLLTAEPSRRPYCGGVRPENFGGSERLRRRVVRDRKGSHQRLGGESARPCARDQGYRRLLPPEGRESRTAAGIPRNVRERGRGSLEGRGWNEEVDFDRADSFVGLFGLIARFLVEGAVHTFHTRRWKRRLRFRTGEKRGVVREGGRRARLGDSSDRSVPLCTADCRRALCVPPRRGLLCASCLSKL